MRIPVTARLITIMIGLMLMTTSVPAGITGKIRGTVMDAQTNESLPGVNVFISSVWQSGYATPFTGQIGAASDLNGNFIILKVPPGLYSVTASMIGYSPTIVKKVMVSADRSAYINIKLSQTVLSLGQQVVVEAQRDVIQVDVASTENYITEQEYQDTPFANRVEDMLELQSGVQGKIIEGEITIRAGETREVAVMLDDVPMVDKKFNRPVFSVAPGAIQEIKVMRSGFNAEYGQASSGIVNLVTKEPEERFHFFMDYQFEPPRQRHYGRNRYDPELRWEWRLMAGSRAFEGDSLFRSEGPLGEWEYWRGWNQVAEELLNDNNPNNDLTAEEAYELWKWRHRPIEYGNQAAHNVDVTFSGPVPKLPFNTRFFSSFKYESRPFTYPQSRDHYDEKMGMLKLNMTLNTDNKLVMTGLISKVASVTQSFSDSPWQNEDQLSYDGGGAGYSELYYPYRKPVIDRDVNLFSLNWKRTISPRSFLEMDLNYFYVNWLVGHGQEASPEDGRYFHGRLYYDPQSGWIPPEKGVEDLATGYKMYGGASTRDHSYNRRAGLNLLYLNQFHSNHELKTGMKFTYDVLFQDRIAFEDDDPQKAFTRKHQVYPIEASAFIQDKIEFLGMIATVGLRFDYFNANSRLFDIHQVLGHNLDEQALWYNNNFYSAVANETFPQTRPSAKYYFSPRIAVSHPLSDRGKIFFNYGHFVQTPPSLTLYQVTLDRSMPRVQWMGNRDMTFEKCIAFEVGYDHNLADLVQIHAGAFYKDYYDVANGMVYAHSDGSLVVEWAAQRKTIESRGIELEVRKGYGRWLTGWFNFSLLQKSESDFRVPDLSEVPIITDDPSKGSNGELKGVASQKIVDVVPYGRGVITFLVPEKWGPRWWGHYWFQRTSLSAQLHYAAGKYEQHPSLKFRLDHPYVRFRYLDQYWLNLRISRAINFNTFQTDFYCDISHVWHTKFRALPIPPANREAYFEELYQSGRLDELGTDNISNPAILNTEEDNIYWGNYKQIIFGLRFNL